MKKSAIALMSFILLSITPFVSVASDYAPGEYYVITFRITHTLSGRQNCKIIPPIVEIGGNKQGTIPESGNGYYENTFKSMESRAPRKASDLPASMIVKSDGITLLRSYCNDAQEIGQGHFLFNCVIDRCR